MKFKRLWSVFRDALIAFLCVMAASGIGWLFRSWEFPETNIVIVYLVSVMLTACFTKGYLYGMAAAIAATGTFNYFFTEPYFTFSVNDLSYLITFAIMTVTAVITSALTSKVKQNALRAQEKEAEASALYRLTSHLTDAATISEIAGITVKSVSDTLSCRAACLCYDENAQPEKSFIQQKNAHEQIHRSLNNREELRFRIEQLRTAYDAGSEFYDFPIYGQDAILGVVRIPKESAQELNETQMRLLHSMIESTALAMDRFRSAQQRIRSKEETERERYRGNLLRAISHDLRTPLSGIMGTSEMLMGMTDREDMRYQLAEGIYKDAGWLHALVENILSLTRLQEGRLMLNKQMEAVEEVVGAAISVIEKRAPEWDIAVEIPDRVLLVPMDAKLIEQVLVNLLDNAVKHTPPENEIRVTVREMQCPGCAEFSVLDRGSGITTEDLPHIFQMFYTTRGKSADAQRGVGLGLAICESIIKAHDGTISATNRTDGAGAIFRFTLPLEGTNDAESSSNDPDCRG